MNAVSKDVEKLVAKELNSANQKNSLFHSYHEAAAVMLEEIEELEDVTSQIRKEYTKVWNDIKNDYEIEKDNLEYMKELAVCAAIEAIQIAAMAQKTIDSELWE